MDVPAGGVSDTGYAMLHLYKPLLESFPIGS
jgi:hypothetical protein